MHNKAIILLSGGLDSTTLLYYAKAKGYRCHCLIFYYGQRHKKEIRIAQKIARKLKCANKTVKMRLPWLGSSLLDAKMKIPEYKKMNIKGIPSTYVPARNIIFLSFAASYAEVIGAQTIFIGANAIDYSGYPDCRPNFFKAYQEMIKQGMKTGVQGHTIKIKAPFVRKTKAQIITLGLRLGVLYELTWSCYQGSVRPCGKCDSCLLRQKGFEALNKSDPL